MRRLSMAAAWCAAAAAVADEFRVRAVVQDRETCALKWADLQTGKEWTATPWERVPGFPKLDPKDNDILQMAHVGGVVVAGVRDHKDGKHHSGYVAVRTGVVAEDHGNHRDWEFAPAPATIATKLDDQQGNPAHVYQYEGKAYIANDRNNGYTRIEPEAPGSAAPLRTRFFPGGGNHITLAVAGNVGYSAWIDGGGPNGGRVDVTRLDAPDPKIAYSFKLAHGGIHGAAVAGGKVFFAPKEGVAWTIVDHATALQPSAVATHALPLGTDPAGKPRRTGAFAAVQDHVLCVTGKGDDAALCVIDARSATPTMATLAVPGGEGNAPLTPEVVRTKAGRLIGLLFHNHPANVQAQDRLTIVDLDPNKDGSLADATVVKRLDVGASKVERHFGHHGVDFDADGAFAFFVSPGAGTLTVLALDDFAPKQELILGGVPSNIVVAGGRKVH